MFSNFFVDFGLGCTSGNRYTQYDLIPSRFAFLNLPSLAIVFGGITASVFISYPFNSVIKALVESTKLFSYSTITHEVLEEDIQRVMDWQKMIKQNKYEAVTQLSEEYADRFEGIYFRFWIPIMTPKIFGSLGRSILKKTTLASKW